MIENLLGLVAVAFSYMVRMERSVLFDLCELFIKPEAKSFVIKNINFNNATLTNIIINCEINDCYMNFSNQHQIEIIRKIKIIIII